MGRYNYIYPCRNIYNNQNTRPEYQDATGFMRLHIIDKESGMDIPYATITVYVTDEARRDIPIMHLVTTINPARIELPIANKLGTLIEGPEYNFSTYNISVDIFGYFTNIIYNNRLFPNVTTDFVIEMIENAKIPFDFILLEDLKSKDNLLSYDCDRYIVAHKGIYDDITNLIADNIAFYIHRAEKIFELIKGKMTMGEITSAAAESFQVNIKNLVKYDLISRMLRCYVDYLYEIGKIRLVIDDGLRKYCPFVVAQTDKTAEYHDILA
jgi:hypothetical protein